MMDMRICEEEDHDEGGREVGSQEGER